MGAVRVATLIALAAAFAYGFAWRVRWRSVIAAAVASLAFGATYLPAVLAEYEFPHASLTAAVVAGGLAALAIAVWAFRRRPITVAPALALAAAVRVPIPVDRGADTGAAPEYLFLLVPLYLLTIAALVAEAMDPDPVDGPPLWRRDPLRLPVTVLVAWAALSTVWTAGQVHGAIRLYCFWLLLPAAYHALWRAMRRPAAERPDESGAGAAALGPADPVRWLPTVAALVVLGSVLGVIGIDQHFRRWLVFQNTNLEATEWQQVIFRVNAIFWDPNMFARFLILAGLLAGALWFAARGRPVRLLALGLVPMLASFYFTYSRSGWLVAVVVAALVVWLRVGWKKAVAALVALSLVVAAMFLVIRAPTFRRTTVQLLEATLGVAQNGRFELKTPVNKLTGGRYGLMAGGLAMYGARPVVGWGLGSFPAVYPDYRPPDAAPALRESHNSLITVAAELGTVGLALLGWALITAGRQASRAVAHARRARGEGGDGAHALAAAAAAGLTALLLHSMLYAALVEDPFTWVFLALIPLAGERSA